jgi:hypothetical protein
MSHETVEPGSIPLHELKQITDDFSEKRRIGRGAYGSVYMVRLYINNILNDMVMQNRKLNHLRC